MREGEVAHERALVPVLERDEAMAWPAAAKARSGDGEAMRGPG